MRQHSYKSGLTVWLPLGLRRIDVYFAWHYLKTFILLTAGLMVLIAIGDLFQRYDDLTAMVDADKRGLVGVLALFADYYLSFVPQLVLQYMLPLTMLLSAALTVTAAWCGPRGNNEFTVIRAAGVPVVRAFLPLVLTALAVAAAFQAGRDHFLPGLVRQYHNLNNRMRSRSSPPTSLSLTDADSFQTIAVGNFSPDGVASNLILELRDIRAFRRGDAALGDNDFTAYRAAAAVLEPAPAGGCQWRPLAKGEVHTYSRFVRRSRPWIDPLPTSITPAMIERQTIGEEVCTWEDLLFLREISGGADFELQWRLAEPLSCCLLILWGVGFCMARLIRFSLGGYIPVVGVSVAIAAVFYVLRLSGKFLWESGTLTSWEGVWLPLALAAVVALLIVWRLEPT
ncbi:MAG: LptF/LptG family permease [Planctomycetota bacterium]|jgi:hypothetical protein|nr:LptF/LptG family permease [Planctomycetota bacterium]